MTTDRLLQRLAGPSWPRPPLDQPDLAEGQLWRAEWRSVACLVVVIGEIEGRTVRVACASPDLVGDESTVAVETQDSMPLAIWTDLTAEIKTFTLSQRISDLTTESVEALQSAHRLQNAWSPITNVLDDRSIIRAELTDELEAMRDAEWLPRSESGGLSLADLAAARNLQPSRLAEALSVTPGSARRLLRGEREPSPEEIGILERVLGSTPTSSVSFDQDLVVELDLPRYRSTLDERAERIYNGDVVGTRRAFASQQMALAARHRQPGERNWRALIQEALSAD